MEWGSGIGISFCCFYYTGSDGLPTGAFTLSFLKKGKKRTLAYGGIFTGTF